MATNTTTYSFLKPTVGGDTNLWGGYLNSNWDDIDDLLDGTTPVTGIDINSGSIDGTPIGASSASTGAFTTLSTSGAASLASLGVTGASTLASLSVTGAASAGSLTLTTDLAVADGGTGASTASAARTNLGIETAVLVAEVASASVGTAQNKVVTSLPTGIFEIDILIKDFSADTGGVLPGAMYLYLQHTGARQSSGYTTNNANLASNAVTTNSFISNPFLISRNDAADDNCAILKLRKEPGTNVWHYESVVGNDANAHTICTGHVTLGGELDGFEFFASGLFDNGTFSYRYSRLAG